MDNTVPEEDVIVEVGPSVVTNQSIFNIALAILSKCIHQVANRLEPFGVLWINYYPRIFGEESVIILPSPLTFIIIGLYAFTEIKSQGSDFPFQTHPGCVKVAITSLLFYGLTSVAEHLISVTGLGLTSVYAIIAQLGRLIKWLGYGQEYINCSRMMARFDGAKRFARNEKKKRIHGFSTSLSDLLYCRKEDYLSEAWKIRDTIVELGDSCCQRQDLYER